MERTRSFFSVTVLLSLFTAVRPEGGPVRQGLMRDPVAASWCTLSFQTVELRRVVNLAGGRSAVCLGTATTSSCDGECASFSASSFQKPVRFNKKCTCCRETQMTLQTIVLAPCFDPADGRLIQGAEFVDEYQQPSECACQPCPV